MAPPSGGRGKAMGAIRRKPRYSTVRWRRRPGDRSNVRTLFLVGLVGLSTVVFLSTYAAIAASASPRVPRFSLMGTHGYRIEVSGSAGRGSSRVTLTARKHGSYASYTVPGTARNGIVAAKFPGLGKVDARFKPKTPRRRGRSGTSAGTFVGTILFQGEHHYTRVDAQKARGSVGPPRNLASPGEPGLPITGSGTFEELQVRSGPVTLEVGTLEGSGTVWFITRDTEPHGNMEIGRSTPVVYAGNDSFEYGGRSWARVDPPEPFLGTGSYTRTSPLEPPNSLGPETSGTGLFSGSLRVELPGLGMVALGDESHASLTEAFSAE